MTGTIAQRLVDARRRTFVGRRAELEVFDAWIESDPPSFAVLHVHGPGGIGKTVLLDAFADRAAARGVGVARVDARDAGPSPERFLRLVPGSLAVLLVDTAELLAPIEPWLWSSWLPGLSEGVRVVLAGRRPPPGGVRADPAWHELVRILPLQPLLATDVGAWLARLGVAEELVGPIFDATRGHPLAVSLVADLVRERGASALARGLAGLEELLRRFVEEAPDPRHRLALETCAHARRTTEELLRAAVGGDDAGELFDWLRQLSFVEHGADGLFPHDVAREVLDADLGWRAPAAYAALHRRVRAHLLERARASTGPALDRACTDILFLHRTNPRIRPFLDWSSLGDATAAPLRDELIAPIRAIAVRHEGEASARLVEHWARRQPEAFAAYVAGGELIGFAALLALHRASPEDLAADPGARAVWDFLQRQRRTAPHEAVMVYRFFMDRDAYQGPSPSFNLMSMGGIRHIVAVPHLAFSAVTCFADPASVAPLFTDIDYHRAPEADFEVGGRRYGGFFHDFARVSVEEWLDWTGEREIDPAPRTPARAGAAAPGRSRRSPTPCARRCATSTAPSGSRGARSPAPRSSRTGRTRRRRPRSSRSSTRPRGPCAGTRATRSCTACWRAPTSTRPRPRSSQPSRSGCRSAPTAATSGGRSSG